MLRSHGYAGRGGLKLTLPLFSRVSLFATGVGGMQYVKGSVTIEGESSVANGETFEGEGWVPTYGGSVGLAYWLGRGKLFVEGSFLNTRLSGQLVGNFGGYSVGLGYSFELGGVGR